MGEQRPSSEIGQVTPEQIFEAFQAIEVLDQPFQDSYHTSRQLERKLRDETFRYVANTSPAYLNVEASLPKGLEQLRADWLRAHWGTIYLNNVIEVESARQRDYLINALKGATVTASKLAASFEFNVIALAEGNQSRPVPAASVAGEVTDLDFIAQHLVIKNAEAEQYVVRVFNPQTRQPAVTLEVAYS